MLPDNPNSIVGLVLLFLTAAATYQGFRHSAYQARYDFYVDGILVERQYDRLLSSGFLHVGWLHFGFNMATLLSFSFSLELLLGPWRLLLLYFTSMLGGSILSLYIHRHHGDYRAVGASGAISGVVFATIVLFPDSEIGILLLPFSIKGWIFALLFLLVSIFGIKNKMDHIGHEAHLGGAITGVLVAVALQPGILQQNWWVVLAILVPVTLFLLLIVRNPAVLMIDNYWGETIKSATTIGRKPTVPQKKVSEQEELNQLLDKIKTSGLASLSPRERQRLEALSK
ncbi:MAG: rhomboid family intramembrane serine protease [Bacteroidetes bacterium]|nr:MAG: rhomboid family intramembrane serine protease [Bacteroidota bacterium]